MWLSLVWLLVLATIIISLIPVAPPLHLRFGDKLAHMAIYAVLATGFAGIYTRSRYRAIAVGLILLGGGLELLQSATGYRMGDWNDFLANGIGIFLGLTLCHLGLGGWCAWIESRCQGFSDSF